MKVIIYIRNGKYHHKNRVEDQREACRKYAAEQGFDVVDEYVSEDMISNPNILDDLIQKCKAKKVSMVLAYNDKLISYPAPNLAFDRVTLMRNHMSLICVRRTTDPAALLLESIYTNLVEFLRTEHSQKVKRGMQLAKERKAAQAAAEGKPVA